MHPVGIDDLHVFAGTLSVEAADILTARGRPPGDAKRFEFQRRSVPAAWEDPLTMAVNAAKPLVDDAGAGDIELLIVATESSVDYGKPLSSYAHKHLGLSPRCRNFELKHACYAGTGGLQLAAGWVRENPAKKALIIATDMSRRIFGNPAEPAEGAGAVAMMVAAHPRVLRLDGKAAYASKEIYDYSRPGPILERVNAILSLENYLDLLELTWEDYRQQAGGKRLEELFDYVLFHTPVIPLIRKAHRMLLESDDEEMSDEEARKSFDRMVLPSVRYTQQTGNLYSATLYESLAGLIDGVPHLDGGARVGLYSYGSGSCAEFFSGMLEPGAKALLARRGIAGSLDARRRVGVPEYERMVLETERGMTDPEFDPDRSFPAAHFEEAYQGKGRLVLEAVRNYRRLYVWS